MKKKFVLNGKNLSFSIIDQLLHSDADKLKFSLSKTALNAMVRSKKYVNEIAQKDVPVYGINTGFGALSSKQIATKDLQKLQYNLIRSHAVGVGPLFSRSVTRTIMLIRANCLIQGHSGIDPKLVNLLLEMINRDITPLVPKQGSVGASGDLAPSAHVAMALIGEGPVNYQSKKMGSKTALKKVGKQPATLGPKDGLALINGTAVMTALGSIAIIEAEKLIKLADIISALTVEVMRGTSLAFKNKISELRPHPGQLKSAHNLERLLKGSQIRKSHLDCKRVQDPYSLRCIPQIHGAVRQTFEHAKQVVDIELNSVTDNPLIFTKDKEIISGGNFHGEPLALCMDYLTMGLSELCSISERRMEKMMNPSFSDLPAFLAHHSGLESGLMIAHVTLASLVSENKILSHPASVDSIPTSTDKEDHVSMGVHAGRKLHQVINNLRYCLAIELLANTHALDFLRPLTTTKHLENVYQEVRQYVKPIKGDRAFGNDIEKIATMLKNPGFLYSIDKALKL